MKSKAQLRDDYSQQLIAACEKVEGLESCGQYKKLLAKAKALATDILNK
jgi:hypothetical protein